MKPADDHNLPPAPTPWLASEEDPRLRLSAMQVKECNLEMKRNLLTMPQPEFSMAAPSKPWTQQNPPESLQRNSYDCRMRLSKIAILSWSSAWMVVIPPIGCTGVSGCSTDVVGGLNLPLILYTHIFAIAQ